MAPILQSAKIDDLVISIEESTRSTRQGVKNFVEPAEGTLRRVVSKRHHLIFGRRGSGKSSLLEKAASDLTLDRRPIAKVDLEAFKGHSYPDVLLSVLIRTFEEFEKWLRTAAINPPNKKSFWDRLFGTTPKRPALSRQNSNRLAEALRESVVKLKDILYREDRSSTEVRMVFENERRREGGAELRIGTDHGSVGVSGSASGAHKDLRETAEQLVHSKTDFLHRNILDYQAIFREMVELSGGDCFLLLDDLYHIPRADQPRLLDYFHRLAKGNGLWLKVGTIRHRSRWYLPGDPPIGLKIQDDVEEINLDLTLEKYGLAKDFLLTILRRFAQARSLSLRDFVTDGAEDRLVLASGGVARDFLSIFRRSVQCARERGGNSRGEKVGAEDVNMAAGEYDTSKREEFKLDTSEGENELVEAFSRIRNFCLEKSETNCFLVDVDAKGPEPQAIHELVDLKLLHHVRSRVTVGNEKYKGRIFEAYMLDLSQYAGVRKRRGFNTIEFWRPEAKEELRRARLIYEADETT